MIEIRYHHLLCIERFQGRGYSPAFCRNMARIKEKFDSESYILVSRCDDICRECPNNRFGVCNDDEKVKKYDLAVKNALENGVKPLPESICSDCRWYPICRN